MHTAVTVGRKLQHYQVLARIGAGGMGEVWRAHDSRLDREVAIKVLPGGGPDTPVHQQRFLREARAASALVHPNIITVHEINSAEGTDFIVMEFVRGEPLSAVLARGRLPVPQSLDYAVQICDALKAAHQAGVIHRDLKPGNIMITPAGLVKVLDFGLAKRVAVAADPDLTSPAPLTLEGTPMGTPAYMSPEQALGDPLDARSDLFSFGIVLYQMLAGTLPFTGTTTSSLVRQIVHEPPQALRTLAPDVPDALARLVNRCLDKDPAQRYPTASALGDDLRALAAQPGRAPAGSDDVTRTARVPRVVPGRGGARRWAPAAVAVVIVAAAGWAGAPAFTRWARNAPPAPATAGPAASPSQLYQGATELLRVYYREGHVDQAIAQLEQALQSKPSYPLAEARLSLAYWRRHTISPDPQWQNQALAYADRAVAGDAQLAVAHLAQGAALSLGGDLDKAEAAYQKAATLDPANWDLLWRLGEIAVARKDLTAAEGFYRRSVEAAPGEWEPYARLGSFYYRQGRYTDALQAFEGMRALADDHARSHSNLAAVYHQLGRTDDAARALQRSLEIAPHDVTYSNLGTLLYFQGRYPEALGAFERALELGANTYARWGNLADAARLTPGGRDKAHQGYTRAVQLARERLASHPADAGARSSVALYLIRDGQPEAALAEIDRVLGSDDLAPATLFKCAIVLELAGRRPRALALVERALAGGYSLREIRQEPDLVHLRADPAYHKLALRYEK